MPTGTVLVLREITPDPGPDSALAARLCAAINTQRPQPPLTIVAHGDLAALLPSIALSQRSSHRSVAGYVLVDPDLPPVTDSWPDAPVVLVSEDEWLVTQARLRGWDLVARADLPARLADT